MTDAIGLWVGAILTLLVFSYLLGDTPLFRIAQAVFVGVAVGYATTVAVYTILLPRLFVPLAVAPALNWPLLVPLVLGLLLLAKVKSAWAPIGNISVAFLFGVGGALAIGGAISGALYPQVAATGSAISLQQGTAELIDGVILVIGTIGALLSFRFVVGGQRPAARVLSLVASRWGYLGRLFILVAFGAIFADTAASRISVLIGRMYFLFHDWLGVVK